MPDIQHCPSPATSEFYEMLLQFGLNLAVLMVISRIMYFRWNRNPDYMFTQLVAGVIVFMICGLLRWVELELGLVLGLFAIFSIIRFRTLNVPVKEMAYLFMVVGISAINAMLRLSHCLPWIIFANTIIIALTFILEKSFFRIRLFRRTIMFSNTELLKPSKRQMLMQELKTMTELDITRIEIGKVDYTKGHAQIRIYFTNEGNGSFTDNEEGNSDD